MVNENGNCNDEDNNDDTNNNNNGDSDVTSITVILIIVIIIIIIIINIIVALTSSKAVTDGSLFIFKEFFLHAFGNLFKIKRLVSSRDIMHFRHTHRFHETYSTMVSRYDSSRNYQIS